MLDTLSLEIIQEIFVRLPLAARLHLGYSAKFLWLAATSPMRSQIGTASTPLEAVLPSPVLGIGAPWLPAATTECNSKGHAVFPPKCKLTNHWVLRDTNYEVVPTRQGNPRAIKHLALAGGGKGTLQGATKWSGVNYVCGVRLVHDIILEPRSQVTFVGCHLQGYIKQLGGGSLTLIGCVLKITPEACSARDKSVYQRKRCERDSGLKVGRRSSLRMISCRVYGPGTKPDIDANRAYSSIIIQDCVFENSCGSGTVSAGYQSYISEEQYIPQRFWLENCTFKPKPLLQMGSDYRPPPDASADEFIRGQRCLWYTGNAAKDFRIRSNDFAGGLLFWAHKVGTMRIEASHFRNFENPRDTLVETRGVNAHVEIYVMDGEKSTGVVAVGDAPTWLRTAVRNGATVCTDNPDRSDFSRS